MIDQAEKDPPDPGDSRRYALEHLLEGLKTGGNQFRHKKSSAPTHPERPSLEELKFRLRRSRDYDWLPQDRLYHSCEARIARLPPQFLALLALRMAQRCRHLFFGSDSENRIIDEALSYQDRRLTEGIGKCDSNPPQAIVGYVDHLLEKERGSLHRRSQKACIATIARYVAFMDPSTSMALVAVSQILMQSRQAFRAFSLQSMSSLEVAEQITRLFLTAFRDDCRWMQRHLVACGAKDGQVPPLPSRDRPLWPKGSPSAFESFDFPNIEPVRLHTVFLSITYTPEAKMLLDQVIIPAVHGAGLTPYLADRQPEAGIITHKILSAVRGCFAIIADITKESKAVSTELGMALMAGKPIILIGAKGSEHDVSIFFKGHEVQIYDLYDPSYGKNLHGRIVDALKSLQILGKQAVIA